jgi:histidinol dehydrogenase
MAAPITYAVNGAQYVAVQAAGESHLKLVDNVAGPCGFLENRF